MFWKLKNHMPHLKIGAMPIQFPMGAMAHAHLCPHIPPNQCLSVLMFVYLLLTRIHRTSQWLRWLLSVFLRRSQTALSTQTGKSCGEPLTTRLSTINLHTGPHRKSHLRQGMSALMQTAGGRAMLASSMMVWSSCASPDANTPARLAV